MKRPMDINIIALLLIIFLHSVLTIQETRVVYLSSDNPKQGFRFSYEDSSFHLTVGRLDKDLRFIYLLETHSNCIDGSYSLRPSTSKQYLSFSPCSVNKIPSFDQKPSCFKIDKNSNMVRNLNGQPIFYRKDDKLNLCLLGLDDYYVAKVNAFEIERSNLLYSETLKSVDTFKKNIIKFKNLRTAQESSSYTDQSTESILRIFESLNINNIN